MPALIASLLQRKTRDWVGFGRAEVEAMACPYLDCGGLACTRFAGFHPPTSALEK